MAGVAGLVDGRLLQQEFVVAIVRVMAITTGHSAETQRVAAGLERVRPAPLVAAKTSLLLGQGIENPVSFAVDLVAGRARYFFSLVCTAEPAQPAVGFMAAQTDLVLLGRWGRGTCSKCKHRQHHTTGPLGTGMIFARAVAGLALEVGKRCVGVCHRSMRRAENRRGRLRHAFRMTQDAGIGATAAVLFSWRKLNGFLRRPGFGLYLPGDTGRSQGGDQRNRQAIKPFTGFFRHQNSL